MNIRSFDEKGTPSFHVSYKGLSILFGFPQKSSNNPTRHGMEEQIDKLIFWALFDGDA